MVLFPRRGVSALLALALFAGAAGLMSAEPAPKEKPIADPDEEFLKEQGIDTDPEAVRAFLRAWAVAPDADRIPQLIARLASDEFEQREQATRELLRLGPLARKALQKAGEDADAEVASRARTCLRKIERGRAVAVSLAAVRVLLKRRPGQTVEALLQYLPFAEDESVTEEIVWGLYELVRDRGQLLSALREALQDKLPARRAVAACIVGRRGEEADLAAVRKLLEDTDPLVRLRAAQGLLVGGDKTGLSALIGLLDESAIEVCWQAEELLHWAAGETAPKAVVGAATAPERKACREAWETWHRGHADKVDLKQRLGDPRRPGLLLLCLGDTKDDSSARGQVVLRGCDGQPRWNLAGGFWDAQLLPGNRLLLGEAYRGPNGEFVDGTVTEREPSGKIVWKTTAPCSDIVCRRLPNGNTFITDGYRGSYGLEVNPEGKRGPGIADQLYEGNPEGPSCHTVGAPQKLRNGRYGWVVKGGPYLAETEPDAEDSVKHKVIKKVAVDPRISGNVRPLEVLPNGHWLVEIEARPVPRGDNIEYVGGPGGLLELNAAGKVVWRHQVAQLRSVARWRDGGTVLGCWGRHGSVGGLAHPLVEVDAAGRKLWEEFPGGLPRRVRICLPLVRLGFDHRPTALVDFDGPEYRGKGLKDKNPLIRLRAAFLLEELGAKAEPAVPGLIEALADPDWGVQKAAGEALWKVGKGAVPAAVRALDDKRVSVRAHAVGLVGALKVQGRIGPEEKAIAAKVLAALGDEDPLVRRQATYAASKFAETDSRVVPALIRALKDKAGAAWPGDRSYSVALDAVSYLGDMGSGAKAAVPALIDMANTGDEELQSTTLLALGKIASKEKSVFGTAVPVLVTALKDKQRKTDPRASAAAALGMLGPDAKDAVPALVEALSVEDVSKGEEELTIRGCALRALGAMGPGAVAAVPDLVVILQDRRYPSYHRRLAAEALGAIGKGANSALAALKAVAGDAREDSRLREESEKAIANIRP